MARLSMSSDVSDCPSMSMNPGETMSPRASIDFFAAAPFRLPMAVMRSPVMPMSAEYQGLPEPSMIWPLRMTTSKACDGLEDGCVRLNGHRLTSNAAVRITDRTGGCTETPGCMNYAEQLSVRAFYLSRR